MLNPEIWKNILQTLQQFWYKYLAPEILLEKLQTPSENIVVHDQAQAQPDKSKIFIPKNDSATSPVPDLFSYHKMLSKENFVTVLKTILLHLFWILDNQNL